ncbi:MAG: DUF1349 domain-containing protein [Chloroflexia bacterium]
MVTDPKSDWSAAPYLEWVNRRVIVRVSWTGISLTVRAGLSASRLSAVRLAPFAADGIVATGPFVCAPTRSGWSSPSTPGVSAHPIHRCTPSSPRLLRRHWRHAAFPQPAGGIRTTFNTWLKDDIPPARA